MWPPYKKSRDFAAKDWIATAIASLALGVSATTAYFNVIRTTDDLSVIATLPELQMTSGGLLQLSSGDVTAIFINSGNRQAAISSFLVSISQLRPDIRFRGNECLDELPNEDRTQIYKTGLDGEIIGNKEMRTERVRLNGKTGPLAFPIAPFNKSLRAFSVVACFDLDIVTPSNANISNYQVVREWQISKDNSGGYDIVVADQPDYSKPLQIYRRIGTIFNGDP
jgi:hypothetical protein